MLLARAGISILPKSRAGMRRSVIATRGGEAMAVDEQQRRQEATGLFGPDHLGVSALDLLERLPEGVAILERPLRVVWANQPFHELAGQGRSFLTEDFYSFFGDGRTSDGWECPIATAFSTRSDASEVLHVSENRHYRLHASPLEIFDGTERVLVTLQDITSQYAQQQKLEAIHQAGSKLTDLKPDEIFALSTEQRIDLLKDNIRFYTRDLLNVEVIEIRLLEQSTKVLVPLLSVGIDQEAADRRLMASPQGNGVTGYVASSGKSYLCLDTESDPLYIEGFKGAQSSLTVPVLLHEQVIGTINVESPVKHAFTKLDMQFLEIFARDVAVALNTLDLLVAQRSNAAQQSCEQIDHAVSIPIDRILLDTVHALQEQGIQGEEILMDRLRSILRNARSIKRSIHQVGQNLAPLDTCNSESHQRYRSLLEGARVLVVDDEEQVCSEAHRLLERFGCIVESAHSVAEAMMMVRSCTAGEPYDLVISEIRLPDESAYQLMNRLVPLLQPVPLIMMKEYGYDVDHVFTRARENGLHPKAILFKPFRLDQLLQVATTILDHCQRVKRGDA